MALADHKLAVPRKGPQCTVCALLESIEPADQVTLLGWLSDPDVRYEAIRSAVLAEFKRDIMAHTFAYHSRGSCAARTRLR